jgi:hypothetical protein
MRKNYLDIEMRVDLSNDVLYNIVHEIYNSPLFQHNVLLGSQRGKPPCIIMGIGRSGGTLMEYYGNRLNDKEKKFYLKILDTLQRRLLFVKADGIMEQQSFLKCISAVQYDYPNLFYVDFSHYTYVAYDDGWEYRPHYLYENKEISRKQQQIDVLVKRIVLEMQKRGLSSVYQKCGYIHSYLVRNCTYDYEALDDPKNRSMAYTIEGPLLERTGVCLGIALAYSLICKSCGINAITVEGRSLRPGTSAYEGHAWNLIQVGESAAHVDVTWDMCLTNPEWPIRYDYFFLPDIDMMRDHQYVRYPICRKLKANYYQRSSSQFQELKELDDFIKNFFRSEENWDQPGTYFFQFRMCNRKETEDDIKNHVKKLIRNFTNKSYSYTVSINSPQSVFSYKIEITD